MDNLRLHGVATKPRAANGEPILQTTCHYALLGIGSDASSEEIAAAYASALARFKRRLAAGNPLPFEQLDALRAAHRTLAEPAARAAYDRSRSIGGTAAPASPPAARPRSEIDAESGAISGAEVAAGLAPGVVAGVAANAAAPAAASARSRNAAAADAGMREESTLQESAVEFHGEGGEYFRIWLVNVALSVLTLGIYSAWAKVRREKYFHRNLVVDGAAFDYHGNPRAILVGRFLLVVLLAVLNFTENIGNAAHGAALIAFAFAFPWLLVRALRFRARNTSYRGVRFAFDGSYGGALVLYLVHGGLTLLSLGLYFPAFLQKQKAFLAGHLRFGETRCHFDAAAAAFYRGLAVPLALWFLLPLSIATAALLPRLLGKDAGMAVAILLPMLMMLVFLLIYVLAVPYIRVVGTNLLWNHTTLGETRFCSTQTVRGYLNLVVGNWLATMLTLGFYWPFAQIRVARYRAAHLTVANAAALGAAVAAAGDNAAAVGDEVTDAFDFDIAL